MKDYFKDKLAAMTWGKRGLMNLHVQRNWTMKQITSHVDAEWREWNKTAFEGEVVKPLGIEIREFGETGKPLRCFRRNDKGKWIEVEAKPWAKEAITGFHNFIDRAVKSARSKVHE